MAGEPRSDSERHANPKLFGVRLDVVVIGAGAAGLAAAHALSSSGLRIAVLEARGRIGGRILTRRESGWPVAVELGAEFLHGEAEATRAVCGVRSGPSPR